jgi:hypothetical protein
MGGFAQYSVPRSVSTLGSGQLARRENCGEFYYVRFSVGVVLPLKC